MIDFNQSQHMVLVELIKQDNPGKPLPDPWVTFDDPVGITPTADIPRNTKIFARSSLDSEYAGNKWFYYNRLDIQDMRFDGLVSDEHLTFDPGLATTTQELAPQLSQIFDLNISPEMITDEQLPLVSPGTPVVVTVTLNPMNKTFIGTVDVTLVRA